MKNTSLAYHIISIAALLSFFLPFVLVFIKKLFKPRAILWFAAYWLLQGIINLMFMSDSLFDSRFMGTFQRIFNLADAPFMLFIFYKTIPVKTIKISVGKMLPAFLSSSLFVTVFTRLDEFMESLIVGAGLLIILAYLIWIILHNIKRIKPDPSTYTLQFVCYGLLFEYGISVITFIFSYLIKDPQNLPDSLLIYHLSIIISIGLVSYGLITHQPVKKKNPRPLMKQEWESEIRYL